ncbi:hypothetical protein GB937_001306 [Aspergillus fischeri]|nr:hypothetical protein GB937_001306 [Aspergillus fischeri]
MQHKKYVSCSLDSSTLQRKAVLGFFAKPEAPGEVVGCVCGHYKRPLASSKREDRSEEWSDSPTKDQELEAESTAWITDINPRG